LGIAEKVFKVIGSEVKVICVQVCECYNGGGIHFDGVASRLICSLWQTELREVKSIVWWLEFHCWVYYH